VYLISDSSDTYEIRNGSRVPTDEIRFRIEPRYHSRDAQTGLPGGLTESPEGAGSRVAGLVLEPVVPFEWESQIMALSDGLSAES
jgi:hypothetical protein